MRRTTCAHSQSLIWIIVLSVAATGWSQSSTSKFLASFSPLPGVVGHQEAALGKRVRGPGKENTLYIGEVIDSSGRRSPAQVHHQLPILARLEGFRTGRVLSFDGERASGVANHR